MVPHSSLTALGHGGLIDAVQAQTRRPRAGRVITHPWRTTGVVSAVLLSFAAGPVAAQSNPCPNTGRLSAADIQALVTVSGRYFCALRNATNEKWNESHIGGADGNVQDFKKGASTVDPTKIVGTYSITGGTDGIIAYSYGDPGSPYRYQVVGTGPYSFCNVATGETFLVIATTSPTVNPNSCP